MVVKIVCISIGASWAFGVNAVNMELELPPEPGPVNRELPPEDEFLPQQDRPELPPEHGPRQQHRPDQHQGQGACPQDNMHFFHRDAENVEPTWTIMSDCTFCFLNFYLKQCFLIKLLITSPNDSNFH